MNVNIPQLADTLFERTASTSWVVVFKSLTATHNLMVYGNEVGLVHCRWRFSFTANAAQLSATVGQWIYRIKVKKSKSALLSIPKYVQYK